MNFINNVINQKIICNETPLCIHYRHDGTNNELDMISNITSTLYDKNNGRIAICSEFQNSFFSTQLCKCIKSKNTNFNISKDAIFCNLNNSYSFRGQSFINIIIHCQAKSLVNTSSHIVDNIFKNIIPLTVRQNNKPIFLIEYDIDCEDYFSINQFNDEIKTLLGNFQQQIYIY
ncbi:hypothetical protein PBI_SCTP2_106 [Salicola phage SCTP-2]|nr:hypothetical protein PBI_SCTP2_106 [Salicola phage SCTP-2]